MKYVATICIALLALVLVLQMRILARLDEIAKGQRTGVMAGQSVPSVASIASEIRKQMAREARLAGPAAFRIESKTASEAYKGRGENRDPTSGRLQRATFRFIREGGPAADISVTSRADITGELKQIKSTEDYERFEVAFRPDSGDYLPNAWRFKITYTGGDQKPQERDFAVTYHPGKKRPDYLDIVETDD